MNLTEAAEYISKPPRTLQRLTAEGVIPSGKNPQNRREAFYDKADLDKFLDQKPAVVQRVALMEPTQALTTAPPITSMNQLIEALTHAVQPPPRLAGAVADVNIESKLSLSLREAAKLSGYSEKFLVSQIKANKLKAAAPGERTRGYNIKRADLEAFVNKL